MVLTASFLAWLLIEHHVGTVGEGLLFTMFAGIQLPLAGSLWLYYVALEPFVRRQWPQILVSWTRLLSGNWRDPLVGRDILIGCAAGVATLSLILVFDLIALRASGAPLGLLPPDWNMLNGVGSFVGALFTQFGNGVFGGLASLLVLFLLRVALRRDWRAAVAYAIVRGLPFAALTLGISWFLLPLGLSIGLISYFVVMRAGLVAAMTSSIVVYVLLLSPLTLHPSAWYAGIGFVLAGGVLALSIYGLTTSLGGRVRLAPAGLDV
jgi:serine/threonine-protein kinase